MRVPTVVGAASNAVVAGIAGKENASLQRIPFWFFLQPKGYFFICSSNILMISLYVT